MRKRLVHLCALLLLTVNATAAAQNATPASQAKADNKNASARRGPVFRATKDQIKQAQALLKRRTLYAGDETGRLDDATRDALRKFQEAEGLKVTGTLNAATLERMSVPLTDRQKEIKRAQEAAKPAAPNN